MKKLILLLSFAFLALLVFYACKKQDTKAASGSNLQAGSLQAKVSAWLEDQKSIVIKSKIPSIELLKENLDFTGARAEQLNEQEQFYIIPLKESFKTKKKVDQNCILNLILVMDQSNTIKRGELVLFTPTAGKAYQQLPENTFYKMYTYQTLGVDGQFKFLSVTGRWIYQLEYKDGKINSYGQVKSKTKSGNKTANLNCTDWYLITTVYISGVAVHETEEYLGTTCVSDEGCSDPDLASVCPDGAGGNGGGGEDCCIPDPNMQFSSNSISQSAGEICGPESMGADGYLTKTCTYTWYYNTSTLLWYTWRYKSIEVAELVKDGSVWKFRKLTHTGKAIEGSLPLCLNAEDQISAANATISPDKSLARMDLQYWVSVRISCLPGTFPVSTMSASYSIWSAK